MVILVISHIAQARKQNGDHCDVIYDITIAGITVKIVVIISLIRIITNTRLGKNCVHLRKNNNFKGGFRNPRWRPNGGFEGQI